MTLRRDKHLSAIEVILRDLLPFEGEIIQFAGHIYDGFMSYLIYWYFENGVSGELNFDYKQQMERLLVEVKAIRELPNENPFSHFIASYQRDWILSFQTRFIEEQDSYPGLIMKRISEISEVEAYEKAIPLSVWRARAKNYERSITEDVETNQAPEQVLASCFDQGSIFNVSEVSGVLDNTKSLLEGVAPDILLAFQGAASTTTLQELEQYVGTALPRDFLNLYLDSDGFKKGCLSNLFYGFTFNSVAQIKSHLAMFSEKEPTALHHADKEIRKDYAFGPFRLPIGSDSGTSLLCVDLDPSEHGKIGQVISLDYKIGVALFLNNSVFDMITQFENDLQSAKYKLQSDALADGIQWLQPDREIDPVNWFNSPRWKHISV